MFWQKYRDYALGNPRGMLLREILREDGDAWQKVVCGDYFRAKWFRGVFLNMVYFFGVVFDPKKVNNADAAALKRCDKWMRTQYKLDHYNYTSPYIPSDMSVIDERIEHVLNSMVYKLPR